MIKWTILTISMFLMSSIATAQGLKVGDKAPQISVKDIAGIEFDLQKSVAKGPTILVFYRGGWCPYCNTQLRKIQEDIYPELSKHKASLVAISVDKVDEGVKTRGNESLKFTVISDPKAQILDAFKLQYKVPEELVSKYKNEYKIDLEASSGEKHHVIAVPAVYIVDATGKITYAFVEPDYKKRADNKDILAALKKAATGS